MIEIAAGVIAGLVAVKVFGASRETASWICVIVTLLGCSMRCSSKSSDDEDYE